MGLLCLDGSTFSDTWLEAWSEMLSNSDEGGTRPYTWSDMFTHRDQGAMHMAIHMIEHVVYKQESRSCTHGHKRDRTRCFQTEIKRLRTADRRSTGPMRRRDFPFQALPHREAHRLGGALQRLPRPQTDPIVGAEATAMAWVEEG